MKALLLTGAAAAALVLAAGATAFSPKTAASRPPHS
jgi:hypothetical protein